MRRAVSSSRRVLTPWTTVNARGAHVMHAKDSFGCRICPRSHGVRALATTPINNESSGVSTATSYGDIHTSPNVQPPQEAPILMEDTDAPLDSAGVPSFGSPAAVWLSWTASMLQSNDSSPSLQQLDVLIKWWARQRPFTTEAAVTTWKLLDRVQQLETDSKQQLQLLKIVLDHWRLASKELRVAVPYAAAEVWERLRAFPGQLDVRTYSILLSAIAHEKENSSKKRPPQNNNSNNNNNSISLAEDILQHYLDPLSQVDGDAPAAVILWNSVLTVIAKQGRGANVGEQAEQMLRRMQDDSSVAADEISYACVLEAWAGTAEHNSEAGVNADRLLREMVDTLGRSRRKKIMDGQSTMEDESNGSTISVDTAASTCYFQVLRAWSKSKNADGADRANEILQGMVQNFLQGRHVNDEPSSSITYYPNVKPTRHCFSAVMSGYADRGKLAKVEQLLLELQNLYQNSGGDPLLYPTTATFNSVFEAYARQGTPASAYKAQQLLERFYRTAMTADTSASNQYYRPCLPDATSVNTCLDAWAESGAHDAAERAEALLLAASEWPGVSPDEYSYTTVMKAWSRSDRPDAAERCEGILRSMWERYEHPALIPDGKSRKRVKPNHITYSTAIYTWSRAAHNNPEAPLRAEAIYQDMLERHRNGDHDLKPSLSVYVSLITAWAHSTLQESDIRAQLYFDQIRGRYMAGDDSLRPTDKVYNALITSKKIRKDGDGAERILMHMYDDYLTHGNKAAMPNRFVFHNVMSAWANSINPSAHQRIEAILLHMQKEHETRKWDCKPNRVSFTILLNCLSRLGTRESAERAESVLRHMYALSEASNDDSVKPCGYSCATALNAWAKTVNVPEAPLRAQAIFDDTMRRYEAGDKALKPNSHAYNSLLTTWAKSTHVDAGHRALAILNEMECRHSMDANNEAPGPFHFTAVISAFSSAGDVDNAEQVLQRMVHRNGIRPHRTCLNALLKAYSRSPRPDQLVERAEQLLHEMKADSSHSPDVISYTTFILCLQRSRRPDAYEKGKAVIEDMMVLSANGETAATPNDKTFVTLLATLNESSDATLDKTKEADYIAGLMQHVHVRPTAGILQELHKIRLTRVSVASPEAGKGDNEGSLATPE